MNNMDYEDQPDCTPEGAWLDTIDCAYQQGKEMAKEIGALKLQSSNSEYDYELTFI